MAFILFVVLPLIACLSFSIISYRNSRPPKDYKPVPGPRGLPLIGNTHQLGKAPQRQLQKWASENGELFKIRLGWENWVFVNSPEAVREIFDKQSAKTSGRMPMPVVSDLLSGENRLLLLTYGTKWRQLRTIVHKLLTPKASETYKPSQDFEAKQLLFDLATGNDDQESFYLHVRRYTTSVVLTSTYGRRVPAWDCDDMREIYQLLKDFSEAAEPGGFVADLFPPLAQIPSCLQWWRPSAIAAYNRQKKTWMRYWDELKSAVNQKKAPECFVKHFIETDFEKLGISDVQAGFVAGSMIEAGSETTSSALNSAILYLSAHPGVQDTANAELTKVVGDDRSPTFSDEADLPYIRAMGKEILRIRPVTNIGSPHYTTADIFYKDYFIPKNTVVAIPQYVLHYSSEKWDNPEAFDPSRYLSYPEKAGFYAAQGDAKGRDHFDFGGGRRICPGMHLAENSLFVTLAKVLWAFKIEPALDPSGNQIPVDLSDDAYEPGVNTLPKPFKARDLVTRHERTLHADAAAITVGGHLGEESQSEDTSSEPEDEHPSNAQNRSPRRQSLFSPEKRRKKSPLPTTRDAGSITVATDTETIATIGLDLAEGNESVPHGVPSLSEPRTEQQTDPRPLGSMGIATEDIAASFLDTSFPYPIPPSVLPLPDGTLDFSQDLGFLNSPSWLAFGLPDDHHSMYDVQLNSCLDTATRTAVNEVSPNSTACDSDLSMAEPEQVVIKDFPLWFTQTRFLLTFYATFSGDQDLVSTSTDESGFYNLIYNQARNKLNSNKAKISTMEWSRWVERESWKRVLGGIYVAGTLRMVIYGINPIFNASNDLEVECFHEETLWNAQSSSEWLSLRPKHEHQEVGTMRDLVEGVLSDDQKRSRLDIARVSHFSLLILTHAVMVHMRQLYQISQTSALCAFSNQSFLGQSLLKTGLESLSRCYNLLQMPHQDRLEDLDDKEIVSLRFSSYGILRAAYIRLFDITTGFDRLTLMAEDPKVIETSVAILAEAPLERDRFLLDAVEKTLEGFQIPFRMGHMLMRKTAAFRWSIEHAVAAWDAGLFVTKWVHSVEIDAINGIEPTRAETDLLTAMKEVLEEADYDTEENRSFSAGLARTWSLFLQDVWVWGITVRMGKVLEHLATAYENHNEAQRQK
ncbi:Cytochrome P450 monooxygenase yanC [Colletotrichum fructicola]|nr:Cytochrome P450 monooxygenase yanC [Colletotrichum fructicola]KAF4936919.1 Cytochrome P450 monooxygenase yanC [Colletotrichum fructicola]